MAGGYYFEWLWWGRAGCLCGVMVGGTHCVCVSGEILMGFQGEVRWGNFIKMLLLLAGVTWIYIRRARKCRDSGCHETAHGEVSPDLVLCCCAVHPRR